MFFLHEPANFLDVNFIISQSPQAT